MRNDIVLDFAVNRSGEDAVFRQVLFGVIRPKANDAFCPYAGHPRNAHELLRTGPVNVHQLRWFVRNPEGGGILSSLRRGVGSAG